jgi:tripartite-type tricarboxylate transporter receptor subunit TctC
MHRRSLLSTLVAGITLAGASAAWAQAADYPKAGAPIRYVVPFPPGGLTDVMARLVGQQLGERWKVPVNIDNKPGSGGQIGAAEVAKAPGDGQTLLAITMAHASNATLFKAKAPFDFAKDLLAAAKSRKLNAGSSGNGTPVHLTLALFNDLNKTDVQHVPYKGGAPSMSDLIGGQLDVVFSNFPESIAHVKSGKLRALAIASSARHPLVPDVPTTAEAGQPQLAVENWTAVMVPGTTPDAIVAKLSSEVVAIMATPDLQERARTQGFRIDARPAAAFAPFLKDEVERWARIITSAKITGE